MTLISKLAEALGVRRRSRPTDLIAVLQGRGTFSVPVVGESYYQDNLEAICGPRTPDGEDRVIQARLLPEPTNPKDNNAIRVEIEGLTVGYLSRSDAIAYHEQIIPKIRPAFRAKAMARIRGGWDRGGTDRGHYGVYLDL